MRVFISILMLMVFFGCSKEKKTNKRLTGTWKPVTLNVINKSNGLTYSADAVGTLTFKESSKRSKTGTYDFSMNYTLKGNEYQLIESGDYELVGEQCFLTSNSADETPTRVIFINKVDLEFGVEKPDTDRLLFVLKKN